MKENTRALPTAGSGTGQDKDQAKFKMSVGMKNFEERVWKVAIVTFDHITDKVTTEKAESENVVAESVSVQQVLTEKVVVEKAAEEKVAIASRRSLRRRIPQPRRSPRSRWIWVSR